MKYSYYRELVKAEAGKRGVDPHTIGSELGQIINALDIIHKINTSEKIKASEKYQKYLSWIPQEKEKLKAAQQRIGQMTGIWADNLEYDLKD